MALDVGIGVLAAIVISHMFSLELTPLTIALGVGLALLPDVDFVYVVMTRGWRDSHAIARHRGLVHYPTVYLPAGCLLLLPLGMEWVALFLCASFGHFIHDSIGIGWGIPWLWPITNANYSFFYKYSPRYHLQHPRRLVYTWERDRIDELIERYGDPRWIRNVYCRPHPFFVTEIAFLILAIAVWWRLG